jgi:hypothetical protein
MISSHLLPISNSFLLFSVDRNVLSGGRGSLGPHGLWRAQMLAKVLFDSEGDVLARKVIDIKRRFK